MIVGLILALYFIFNEDALKSVVSVGIADHENRNEVVIYQDPYIVGVDTSTCRVRWISTSVEVNDSTNLPCMPNLESQGDITCLIDQNIDDYDAPIWREYCKNRADWLADCDRFVAIVGHLEDKKALFSANLCISKKSKMIGYIIPDTITDLPLYHYAVSVDSLERLMKIDFFQDILVTEDEVILERQKERLMWSYQPSYYKMRLEDNKEKNGN